MFVLDGDKMRQANSTIKGYSYQFNKSILEILQAEEYAEIVLEGVIEDIDIHSPTSTTTIQCKYHEDKKFQISSVVPPILEMLCHYCECAYLGKSISYILYAYYADNVGSIDIAEFVKFLESTMDKDIMLKYFHRIYSIPDSAILSIANKSKRNNLEKEELLNYYKTNRNSLSLRVNIQDFWNSFTYVKAEQYDDLQAKVIQELENITDHDTAKALFYPNAFSRVAYLSSKSDRSDRTITKSDFVDYLLNQKSVLLTSWAIEILGKEQILKAKKEYLSSAFASNPDVRAFVFSDAFLEASGNKIVTFIHEYISKYFRKRKLHKPPIFIFGNNHADLMQSTLLELYKYQEPVNTGYLGSVFLEDSFISNTNCSPNFSCKIALLSKISVGVLEKCNVNQLYIIGSIDTSFDSPNYYIEQLDIADISSLRYLVGLTRTLEV